MKKINPLMTALVLAATVAVASGSAFADPVIDEDAVRAISAETLQAAKDGDTSVIQKYFYSGSKIVIDLDPADDAGQSEIAYEEFVQLAEMGMEALSNAEFVVEITGIAVDEKKNQATVEETSTVVSQMMGVLLTQVSVTETLYGVVDGQIKVLEAVERLVSMDVVQ